MRAPPGWEHNIKRLKQILDVFQAREACLCFRPANWVRSTWTNSSSSRAPRCSAASGIFRICCKHMLERTKRPAGFNRQETNKTLVNQVQWISIFFESRTDESPVIVEYLYLIFIFHVVLIINNILLIKISVLLKTSQKIPNTILFFFLFLTHFYGPTTKHECHKCIHKPY